MGFDSQGYDSIDIKGRLMERLEITHFIWHQYRTYDFATPNGFIDDLMDQMTEWAYNELKYHKWVVESVYPAEKGLLTGWEVVYSTQIPRNKKLLLLVNGIMA
jgi:hypothetical protein